MACILVFSVGFAWVSFFNIFASKVSRKNKGIVSNFFGQSVTNDTSTPDWVPLYYSTLVHAQYSTLLQYFCIWRSIVSILSAMHSKLLRVHTVLYINKLHCLWNVNVYILYCTLVHCLCTIVTDSNFLWPIVVISWLKAQRPKFNAYILNLNGPKKSRSGAKIWARGPRSGQPCSKYLFHCQLISSL